MFLSLACKLWTSSPSSRWFVLFPTSDRKGQNEHAQCVFWCINITLIDRTTKSALNLLSCEMSMGTKELCASSCFSNLFVAFWTVMSGDFANGKYQGKPKEWPGDHCDKERQENRKASNLSCRHGSYRCFATEWAINRLRKATLMTE